MNSNNIMDSEIKALEKRITALENNKTIPEKKDRAPRKESEYNKFMKNYIADEKKKGSTKSHKDLFADGAKAWGLHKEKK
jgi:hypothetical protein